MLKNYLIISIRNFLKYKFFTLINLSGLAIALACTILIYLFIHQELTFDHIHDKKDRIYKVVAIENNISTGTKEFTVVQPYPLGPAMLEDLPEVKSFIRFSFQYRRLVKVDDVILEEKFILADSTLFDVFSFPLLYGNPDHALVEPNAVAISRTAAEKYFGKANPIGEALSIRMTDTFEEYQVTAVFEDIPANSSIRSDFFLSMVKENARKNYSFIDENPWNASAFRTYLLLHENASLSSLEEKLSAFRAKYFPNEADFLTEWEKQRGEELTRGYYLQPLTEAHLNPEIIDPLSPASDPMYLYIMGAIGFSILLLAAINFTLLSISRSHGRAKEIGIRKVVGARRAQLTGQFLSEAMLTSFLALWLAMLIIILSLPILNELAEKELSLAVLFQPFSLIVLLAITLLTGLLSGAYPSWLLSSLNTLHILKNHLKPGGNSRLAQVLLTSQFVLPILFLIITAVMIQQLQYMREKDLGFQSEHIVVIENNTADQQQVYERFAHLARQRTDVKAMTATSVAFTKGELTYYMTDKEEHAPKDVIVYQVKPNFFEVLDIAFAEGRPFKAHLSSDSVEAIIVNEAMVKAFGWTDPIGKELEGRRVIGVVKDFHYQTLAQAIAPMAFYLHKDKNSLNHVLFELQSHDLKKSLNELSKLWKQVVPDLPFQYSFLQEDMQALYEQEERWSRILQWISGLAIFIACMGLVGVTGLTISNRTKEIGIRKVLGASVSSILLMLCKGYIKMILIALLIAVPIANYFITEWLQNFAYRIDIKWWLFAVPGLLVLVTALFSVSGQTVKAANKNPVDSLRYE